MLEAERMHEGSAIRPSERPVTILDRVGPAGPVVAIVGTTLVLLLLILTVVAASIGLGYEGRGGVGPDRPPPPPSSSK